MADEPEYTLVAEVEPQLEANIPAEELELVEEFEWSVTRTGENITFKLGSGENEKSEVHKTTDIRAYLLKNYNWNGIVNLIESTAQKDDEFTYERPLNLTGIPSNDDILIIPDDATESIIRLQAKYQIEDKHKDNPEEKIDDILKAVDGKPKKGFAKNTLESTYMDLLKESDNSEMQYKGTPFTMPNIETSSQETIYNFLRNLALSRNGLWSDQDKVTNFISIRRALETSSSKYNDTLFVAWREGNTKNAIQYIGSTEPGDIGASKDGKLLPQTLTMLLGIHTGSSSATPGGRTRSAVRKSRGSSSEYFESNDTTMNIHYGHPNIVGLPTGYGLHNNATAGGYTATQTEAYLTLVRVYHILTQWGAGKTGISAYKNLKYQAKTFKRSEVKETNDGTKKIEIYEGESTLVKTLKYSDYTSYITTNFSETQKEAANTSRKTNAISLLKDKYSDNTYSDKTLTDLVDELKKEDMWKYIIDVQMESSKNMTGVDAKPGKNTLKKMNRTDEGKEVEKNEYEKLTKKAQEDLDSVNNLFTKWDNNSILKNRKQGGIKLKKHFQDKIKLNKEDFDKTNANDVDNVGGKGMNKKVSGWSDGCQIVYGGQNFYQFLYNLTQFVDSSNQERWYYSIVDMTNITGVTQGTPTPVTPTTPATPTTPTTNSGR